MPLHSSKLLKAALASPRPVSLKTLADIAGVEGTKITGAQFLFTEMPTRLLETLKLINTQAPKVLSKRPELQQLSEVYMRNVEDILESPLPICDATTNKFIDKLYSIRSRQQSNIETLSKGVQATISQGSNEGMQAFLDKFFTLDISQSLLINEQIALSTNAENPVKECKAVEICNKAVASAQSRFRHVFPNAKPLTVHITSTEQDISTLYVPNHLHRILYEVLKTSMISTRKFHKTENLPPIRIYISKGLEDVAFKIDVEDGGIAPNSDLSRIWSYQFDPVHILKDENSDVKFYPFKEYCIPGSFSLPFARQLARYFGGELQVATADGYGSDYYLFLNDRDLVFENLPKKRSKKDDDSAWVLQLGWKGLKM